MKKYIDASKIEYGDINMGIAVFGQVTFKEDIDKIPAEDVEEVKHGEWTHTGLCYECSICKSGRIGFPKTKYCPNCGAKMYGAIGEKK